MKLLSLTAVVATLFTSVFARSSVHIVSNNDVVTTEPTEVSLGAFNMFYSHLMGTSANQPALFLQDVQDISHFLPQTNVFTKKASAKLFVVIAGASQDILTEPTSFYVSDDVSGDYTNLIENTLRELNGDDNTTTTFKNQKIEMKQENIVTPMASLSAEESFVYFKKDFGHLNASVFDINNEVDKMFVEEVEDLREMYSNGRTFEPSDIRLVEINTLEKLGQEYGVESKQYKEAHLILRDLFEKFVIPNFQQLYVDAISTVITTPMIKQQTKRALSINKKLAATLDDVCYKSASACNKGTSHCSGNGQCTEVQESCFSCQCNPNYVGETCQYVDAVSDFQLLFWTSVLLVVITASVVVCVYQSGNIVDGGIIMAQSLPKQE